MTRFLLSLLIGAALLAGIPAQAFWQSRDSNYNVSINTGATYTGPGDVVSGATAWYGLRAYNAAYAATPGKSVNVRRASDNVACDVNVAATGGLGLTTATCNSSTQGGITPTAFAGTDATATCTLASTTATCVSASSTPHVGSTVVGASLTQPCLITAVGTFTGGAGTFTASLAGTSTSCGAIGSGETFTMTYGLFVTEWYDQSGSSNHATQATAGTQPQLLPSYLNSLPAVFFLPSVLVSGAITDTAQPYSFSEVVIRTANFSSDGSFLLSVNVGGTLGALLESISANTLFASAGTNLTATMTDSAWHAFQALFATTGVLNVDGTETSGTVGARSSSVGPLFIGGRSSSTGNLHGAMKEAGYWPLGFSSGNRGALHTNQSAYWGTP